MEEGEVFSRPSTYISISSLFAKPVSAFFFGRATNGFFLFLLMGKMGHLFSKRNVISRIFSRIIYNFLSVRYARKLSCGGGNESRHMYTPTTTTVKRGSGVRFQKGEREREERGEKRRAEILSFSSFLLPILSPFLALREREREQKSQKRRGGGCRRLIGARRRREGRPETREVSVSGGKGKRKRAAAAAATVGATQGNHHHHHHPPRFPKKRVVG